jgi:hypothetical protein
MNSFIIVRSPFNIVSSPSVIRRLVRYGESVLWCLILGLQGSNWPRWINSGVQCILRSTSNFVRCPSNIVGSPSNILSSPSNILSSPSVVKRLVHCGESVLWYLVLGLQVTKCPRSINSGVQLIVRSPSNFVRSPSNILSSPSVVRHLVHCGESVLWYLILGLQLTNWPRWINSGVQLLVRSPSTFVRSPYNIVCSPSNVVSSPKVL